MEPKKKTRMDISYESYLLWMTRFGYLFEKNCKTLTKKQFRQVWLNLNKTLRPSHNTPREIARLCGSQNVSVYRIIRAQSI